MQARPMGFYHQDGLVAAWKFAAHYADLGSGGRIATLPDVISARMGTKPGNSAWERYYTTASAEYFGKTREGTYAVIVAHGVGPMTTLDGILAAYGHEFRDKTRRSRGGRITQQQFWDLERGVYGDVTVIPLSELLAVGEYPLHTRDRADAVMSNPLLVARLGPKAEQFVARYKKFASQWHERERYNAQPNRHGLALRDYEDLVMRERATHVRDRWNPYILFNSGPSNCSYFWNRHGELEIMYPDEVVAHLLSISALSNSHHDGHVSLITDIRCHEWTDGTRLIGVPAGAAMRTLRQAPTPSAALFDKHWRKLMVVCEPTVHLGMRHIRRIGSEYFTEYPKKGARVDTGEPEYRVTNMVKIGLPVPFETLIGGHEVFFRYDMSEIRAIAPRTANVYEFVSDIDVEWEGGSPVRHRALIQFYRAEVDTSARLPRTDELAKDYDTLMSLVA